MVILGKRVQTGNYCVLSSRVVILKQLHSEKYFISWFPSVSPLCQFRALYNFSIFLDYVER